MVPSGNQGTFREPSWEPFREPFWEPFRGVFLGKPADRHIGRAKNLSAICFRESAPIFIPFKKADFLQKIQDIREKIGIWGLGGLGVIFTNIIGRIARELRRIILFHLGLVTFRFHHWKTPKPLIFMVLGTGGGDHDSRNQYVLSLETPGHSK